MYKKLSLSVVLLLLCIAAAGVTLAYRSASITANNVITFGSIRLKLNETRLNENGEEVVVDTSQSINVTSAGCQKRKFYVENKGKNPLYTRVCFAIAGTTKDGQAFSTTDYLDVLGKGAKWIYQEGWYYYTEVVEPKQCSKELSVEVIFDIHGLTKKYPGCQFDLVAYAQGVQSENNEENVLKVKGWPKEAKNL